jgi:hypothetical protein
MIASPADTIKLARLFAKICRSSMNRQIRKYFYEIDRAGKLIHDGTVLHDAAFLDFFFARLAENSTGEHAEFPFVSPCGREMNYVRCHDVPIVFRALSGDQLLYAASLRVRFQEEKLAHSTAGQLYHPAPVGNWGLIGRELLLELAPYLEEEQGRYFLDYASKRFPLQILK